jgi:protein-tyrosine-phosphatase/DNA-binding transcriptional ArsR family regulator
MISDALTARAERHAALGDPIRLAIVDELARSDRSPAELGRQFDLPSNLVSHHLAVLERVGIIERTRSSGDARRRYVHLRREPLDHSTPTGDPNRRAASPPALFVCTANSARSQLAAALWFDATGAAATSAGTRPAAQVHPGAIAAARRAGLDLDAAVPTAFDPDADLPPLVVTVCDQAHEELDADLSWLHWSIPDPVPTPTDSTFDSTLQELRVRIERLSHGVRAA